MSCSKNLPLGSVNYFIKIGFINAISLKVEEPI